MKHQSKVLRFKPNYRTAVELLYITLYVVWNLYTLLYRWGSTFTPVQYLHGMPHNLVVLVSFKINVSHVMWFFIYLDKTILLTEHMVSFYSALSLAAVPSDFLHHTAQPSLFLSWIFKLAFCSSTLLFVHIRT